MASYNYKIRYVEELPRSYVDNINATMKSPGNSIIYPFNGIPINIGSATGIDYIHMSDNSTSLNMFYPFKNVTSISFSDSVGTLVNLNSNE